MTTQTASAIEFRCNRCWNPNFAPVEQSGKNSQCHVCQAELIVPEVTPDRLRSSEVLGTAGKPQIIDDRQQKSDAELMRMVQKENNVSPGNREFAGYPDASRLLRLVASFVDGVYMMLSFGLGIGAVIFAVSLGFIEPPQPHAETFDPPTMIVFSFFPLVALIVQWNLIATRGQSIGKLVTCIRIISVNGKLPGFVFGVVLRNWLRNLLGFIPFFGLLDILFIFGGSSRCIHDYLAGTRVVQA